MAVKTSPRQHQIQPLSLCELVDALQTAQRTVGTKVQAKVRSQEGSYLQAAERRVGPRSAARLDTHLDPGIAGQDEHGPHQFPTIRWSIVGEVGTRTQSQRVCDP